MLVLSRKIGERLVIGEAVVTVLSFSRGQIKLGIEAPRHVEVSRPDEKKETR